MKSKREFLVDEAQDNVQIVAEWLFLIVFFPIWFPMRLCRKVFARKES